MKKETSKGKLLCSLLKGPKTTAELAQKNGYVTDGTVRYNMINRDLQDLTKKGYIKSEKVKLEKKRGNIPTLYSINFNIQNLGSILEEYPYLIEKMQRSKFVFEAIFREHSDLIYTLTDKEYVDQIKEIKILIKLNKKKFKEMLKLSTEFFKFFVMNDNGKVKSRIRSIVLNSKEELYAKYFIINNNPDSYVRINETVFGINLVFETCVNADILNGKFNSKAVEYVRQMRNEISDEQIETLNNYYINVETAPEFLRGKKLISIKNPKLREIEHEFLDKGGKFVHYGI